MNRCLIIGAGESLLPLPDAKLFQLVIAADGGYAYAQRENIPIDVLIGDFDSLAEIPTSAAPQILRLPPVKDQTDTLAALDYGLEHGCTHFHIYGGAGGRVDHTLANIQCLSYLAERGARGLLYDGKSVITSFRGSIRLAAQTTGYVSVFAFSGIAEGVCLQGLKYELNDATLSPAFPLGVSNEFIGLPVHISARRGILTVVYPIGTTEV